MVETLFRTANDSPRPVYYSVKPMQLFDELKAERSSRRAFQINRVLSLWVLLSFALSWLNAQSQREAFVLGLMEMSLQGVSSRKVSKITEALCGISFSKSTVSELCVESGVLS